MSLVSQTISNLANGISQQAPTARSPSQAELQENCQSTVVDGLRRRPPTHHIAKVSTATTYGDAFVHTIDRDSAEKYAAVFLDGLVKVFDLQTGEEQTVNHPDGWDYLDAADPRTTIRATTAADFTFVINRAVEVGMLAELSPVPAPKAMVFFRSATYREKFVLKVNSNEWSLQMPLLGGSNNNSQWLSTNITAKGFHELLTTGSVTALASTDTTPFSSTATITSLGFTATLEGSIITITRSDGADFTISGVDGNGNEHMKVIKGTVQRFSDLPRIGIDGFSLKVVGDPDNNATDYWVQYRTEEPDPVALSLPAGGDTGEVGGSGGGAGGITPFDPYERDPYFAFIP
jgi:hypothetical protein